jgi:hypothetical protein
MHASVKVNPATNEIRRRNSRRPLVKLPSIEPQRSPQRTASMKLRHRFNYSPRSSKAPLTSAEIVFASDAPKMTEFLKMFTDKEGFSFDLSDHSIWHCGRL